MKLRFNKFELFVEESPPRFFAGKRLHSFTGGRSSHAGELGRWMLL